jgi:hypothetical protein
MRITNAYWSIPENEKELLARLEADEPQIEEARRGDLTSLKNKYPHLAEFFRLPKRPGKGKRFPKDKLQEVLKDPAAWELTNAVWDAATIRDIWRRAYPVKPKGYDAPEEYAARRWGRSVRHVERWKRSKSLPKNPYQR